MAMTTRVVERSRARACVPLAQLLALHGLALLVGARKEDVLVAHLRRLDPNVHVPDNSTRVMGGPRREGETQGDIV